MNNSIEQTQYTPIEDDQYTPDNQHTPIEQAQYTPIEDNHHIYSIDRSFDSPFVESIESSNTYPDIESSNTDPDIESIESSNTDPDIESIKSSNTDPDIESIKSPVPPQDNIIQWIFEKMFKQLVKSDMLYTVPFYQIMQKTFDNTHIHQIINKLTCRPLEQIAEYLTNKTVQERILLPMMKNKLHVCIGLGLLSRVRYLINIGYRVDNKCLQLIAVNNYLPVLKLVLDNTTVKTDSELLIYCAENGSDETYFYLRDRNLYPNLSIFNRAACSNSVMIFKDINSQIGLTNDIIELVFQSNHVEIIKELLTECANTDTKIPPKMAFYPILNNDFDTLFKLEKLMAIDWSVNLFHAAILSGSVQMLQLLESKVPDIHSGLKLDTGKENKGTATLLIYEMIYVVNNKKYFSHSINYAIQSGSTLMLKYIKSKGYQITVSNFITAIKQGTCSQLTYLCDNYDGILPFYLIHYFGFNIYVPDKLLKAKILIDRGIMDIKLDLVLKKTDYQSETTHIEIIGQTTEMSEDCSMDLDFLLMRKYFFQPVMGFKFNSRLLTKTRLCLELDIDTELTKIFKQKHNAVDSQFILDMLILFGSIKQIIKYYPIYNQCIATTIFPSRSVVMEIMCYRQINKLMYMFQHNLLTTMTDNIKNLATIMNDHLLNLFVDKIVQADGICSTNDAICGINNNIDMPNNMLKYVLMSGNIKLLDKWICANGLDMRSVKNILLTDNMQLVRRLDIPSDLILELIEWTAELELIEINNYLIGINNPVK